MATRRRLYVSSIDLTCYFWRQPLALIRHTVLLSLFKPEKNLEVLSEGEYRQVFKDYFKSVRSFVYYRCGDVDMAEDIAQDVFVKLWETRGKIDKRTIKAYLYTIAQNVTINQLKRKQLMFQFQQKPSVDRDYDNPEKLLEMKEYQERLNRVLAMLPDGGREVFLMNRLEDMTYVEIAERLGLSVKAVEKRMSKVLRILREKLGTEL